MSEHTAESDVPASGPLAGQFCGQQQPHSAHTWETPRAYGVTVLVSTYQCAGLIRVTSPGE